MSEPSKGDAEGSPPMKKQDQGHEEQKEGKEKRGKDGDSTFSGVKGDEWDLSNMTGPLKPKTRVFVPEDQSRASLGDHQGKILNFSVDQGWDWTEADFDIEAELDTIKSGHFVAWIGLENYDDPFTDDKEWDEHFGASMEKLLQDLKNLEKRPNKIFVSSEVFYSVKAVEYLIELGEWAGIKDWVIMVEKEHNGDIDSYLGVPPFGQALVDGSLPAKHLCVSSPSDRIQESFLRHLNGVAGSVSNLEVLCFLTPKGNRIPSHEHEKPLDSLLALLQPNKIFSRVSTLVFLGTELGTDGYPNLKPLVKQLAHNCKDQKKIPILLLSNIRVKGFNNFGHLLTEIEKVVMPILGKGTDDTYEAARFFVPDNQVAGGQLKDSETRFYTSFKFGTMDECILPRIRDMLGCIGFERAVACGDQRNGITQTDIQLVSKAIDGYQAVGINAAAASDSEGNQSWRVALSGGNWHRYKPTSSFWVKCTNQANEPTEVSKSLAEETKKQGIEVGPYTDPVQMFCDAHHICTDSLRNRKESYYIERALDAALRDAMKKNGPAPLYPLIQLAIQMSKTPPDIFGRDCFSVNAVDGRRVKFQLNKLSHYQLQDGDWLEERFDIVFWTVSYKLLGKNFELNGWPSLPPSMVPLSSQWTGKFVAVDSDLPFRPTSHHCATQKFVQLLADPKTWDGFRPHQTSPLLRRYQDPAELFTESLEIWNAVCPDLFGEARGVSFWWKLIMDLLGPRSDDLSPFLESKILQHAFRLTQTSPTIFGDVYINQDTGELLFAGGSCTNLGVIEDSIKFEGKLDNSKIPQLEQRRHERHDMLQWQACYWIFGRCSRWLVEHAPEAGSGIVRQASSSPESKPPAKKAKAATCEASEAIGALTMKNAVHFLESGSQEDASDSIQESNTSSSTNDRFVEPPADGRNGWINYRTEPGHNGFDLRLEFVTRTGTAKESYYYPEDAIKEWSRTVDMALKHDMKEKAEKSYSFPDLSHWDFLQALYYSTDPSSYQEADCIYFHEHLSLLKERNEGVLNYFTLYCMYDVQQGLERCDKVYRHLLYSRNIEDVLDAIDKAPKGPLPETLARMQNFVPHSAFCACNMEGTRRFPLQRAKLLQASLADNTIHFPYKGFDQVDKSSTMFAEQSTEKINRTIQFSRIEAIEICGMWCGRDADHKLRCEPVECSKEIPRKFGCFRSVEQFQFSDEDDELTGDWTIHVEIPEEEWIIVARQEKPNKSIQLFVGPEWTRNNVDVPQTGWMKTESCPSSVDDVWIASVHVKRDPFKRDASNSWYYDSLWF